MHAHNTKSASENDVTTLGNALLKEIELSETSSDINKPVANKNSRASAKRKKVLNSDQCHSDQMEVELKVIHNGNIYDEDSTQTASC